MGLRLILVFTLLLFSSKCLPNYNLCLPKFKDQYFQDFADLAIFFSDKLTVQTLNCTIPLQLKGSWFSWENGQNTLIEIDADSVSTRGHCVDSQEEHHVNYTLVLRKDNCYYCTKFIIRTVNVVEKLESIKHFFESKF